ncbi:hypothetical protein BWD121_012470 [Bartonella sp. WD12.1]|nr:hypothetical protein BWD121_012470 [Bartonella sp. WD12.1]
MGFFTRHPPSSLGPRNQTFPSVVAVHHFPSPHPQPSPASPQHSSTKQQLQPSSPSIHCTLLFLLLIHRPFPTALPSTLHQRSLFSSQNTPPSSLFQNLPTLARISLTPQPFTPFCSHQPRPHPQHFPHT